VGLAAARARLRPPDEAAVSQSTDRALLQVLQAWRARVARGADVPVSVVLADRTLVAIAQRRPTERRHLVDVAGLGPLKLAEHGDTILGLVADHTDRLAAGDGFEDECGSS
jgi:ribonuclease D